MDKQDYKQDNIDIVKLVNVLLKRKWLVIIGTLVVVLISAAVSMILPRVYRSEGFIQFSSGGMDTLSPDIDELRNKHGEQDSTGLHNNMLLNETLLMNELLLMNQVLEGGSLMTKSMSIPDYKKYLPQFTDKRKFQLFLSFLETQQKTGKEKQNFTGSIGNGIEPIYAFNKKDLSDMGQISRDAPNFVVGIKVRNEQSSPQKAQAFVTAFGLFTRDCILYNKLNVYITIQLKKTGAASLDYENDIIRDEFKLNQTGNPTIKENLAFNRRNLQLEELKFDFFSKAKTLLEKEKLGQPLLRQCMELKDKLLGTPGVPEDIVRQVKNELARDFDILRNLCDSIRFMSDPSLPSGSISPNKKLIWVVSFVLALCFFVALAFGIEWWKTNKNRSV
jgi:hypothetical protein